MENKQKRIISLDILRGVAILLVIFNHLEPSYVTAINKIGGKEGFLFWHFKTFGQTGVSLFFVLSGFLIGGLLFKEIDMTSKLSVFKFWIRRGLKIWPSYIVLLIVLAVTNATHYIDYTSKWSAVKSFCAHLFFLQNYLPTVPNGSTWSLAVEEHFYMLLPLILLVLIALAKRTKKEWFHYIPHVTAISVVGCMGLRILQSIHGLGPNDHMRTHFMFDSLMIGVFCCYLWNKKPEVIEFIYKKKYSSLLLAACLICPIILFSSINLNPITFSFGFFTLSVGYAIMLLLMYRGLTRKIEGSLIARGIARIGIWSYNIYLWNFFVFKLHLPFFDSINSIIASNIHNVNICVFLQFLVYACYTIFLGFLATVVIENPFIRLRNRFFKTQYKITKDDFISELKENKRQSETKAAEDVIGLPKRVFGLKYLVKTLSGISVISIVVISIISKIRH